jgi:hypothetical protein
VSLGNKGSCVTVFYPTAYGRLWLGAARDAVCCAMQDVVSTFVRQAAQLQLMRTPNSLMLLSCNCWLLNKFLVRCALPGAHL